MHELTLFEEFHLQKSLCKYPSISVVCNEFKKKTKKEKKKHSSPDLG